MIPTRRWVMKPLVALGLVMANVAWPPAPVMTPGLDLNAVEGESWPEPRTLDDLYQRRDRLQQLAQVADPVTPPGPESAAPPRFLAVALPPKTRQR